MSSYFFSWFIVYPRPVGLYFLFGLYVPRTPLLATATVLVEESSPPEDPGRPSLGTYPWTPSVCRGSQDSLGCPGGKDDT